MSFFHGKVELKDTKNCCISLPQKWNFKNHQNHFNLIVLKVIFLDDIKCDKFIYVTWNGTHNNSFNENVVSFDRLFASKMGIQADESILVQAVNETKKFDQCISCNMRPLSEDDYQLVMANFSEIENELMNQIRIFTTAFFNEKQHRFNVIPIWVRNCSSTPIFIEIMNFEPKNPNGLIFTDSTKLLIHSPSEEIEFEPELKENNNNKFNFDENNSAIKAVFGLFKSIIPKHQMSLNSNSSSSMDNNKLICNKSIPLYRGKTFLLRVLPCCLDLKNLGNLSNYCTAFVSDVHFQSAKENYCLVKLRKLLTINERNELKKTKNDTQSNYSIDTSSLSLEDKFHTLFVDRTLKTFEERTDFVLLIFASKNCPSDSIMLNDNFRIQNSISATSYVQLGELGASETNLNINHFDDVYYLSIPSVNQLTLYPIDYNFVQSDNIVNNIKREFRKLFASKDDLCFKTSLFVYNLFAIKLSNINFFLYYNEVPFVDLDRCDFEKLRNSCFLCDLDVEISVKSVTIKNNILKLIPKLSKDARQLDIAHLSMLDDKTFLSKPFGGFSQIFEKCLGWINNGLELVENTQISKENLIGPFLSENLTIFNLFSSLLICGAKGSGKSTLLERILYHFVQKNYAFCHVVQCRFIKGKRIESLQKLWSNLIQEAIQRQPSILVFEDLDEIAYYTEEKPNAGSESNENVSPESVYCERVAYVFRSIVNQLKQLKSSSTFSKVVIVSTAKSRQSLHKLLQLGNVFNETIELIPPDSKRRADIIQEIVNKKDLSLPNRQLRASINFNLKRISRATKSFNPDDLNQFVDIALHNALVHVLSLGYQNIESNEIGIGCENVDYALKEFVPSQLQGLNLQINSQRCLDDVGGLNEIKEIILNTISLPSKYPKLYAQLPLKPPNSLLLYGMPGTGKTLLVEAIAHESGMNFIGVKGPELLSKYIGASEQSVRDLFVRAQQAAPCILFFDEFDSLAPRRGHDSTGVTDRIVNQLLTLLDGLEEMRRDVYILAATSRPDLIDLALLRPGRFDRCLLLDLPNDAERLLIFNALSRKLPINIESIDFQWFVTQTKRFTGADIQALLYTAYLNALKRLPTPTGNDSAATATEEEEQEEEDVEDSVTMTPMITDDDIRQARQCTFPSNVDIDKFNKIYERFNQQLAGKIVDNPEPKMATLA